VSEREASPNESPPGRPAPEELVLLQPHTGWYDDPEDPARRRYWDGVAWRGAARDDVPSAGPLPAPRLVPRSELPEYRPPRVGFPRDLSPAERLRAGVIASLIAGALTLLGPLFIWYRTPRGYVTLWSAHPVLAALTTLAGLVALAGALACGRASRPAGAVASGAAALALLCVLIGLRPPDGGHVERGALVATLAALALSFATTTAWLAAREP